MNEIIYDNSASAKWAAYIDGDSKHIDAEWRNIAAVK